MELQDRIEIAGTDALGGNKGLRKSGGLPRHGLLDGESAGQDVAMQNKSAGSGGALAGAGHGEFPGVGFGDAPVSVVVTVQRFLRPRLLF